MDQDRESNPESGRSEESITVPLILLIACVTLGVIAVVIGTLRDTGEADAESAAAITTPTPTEVDQPEPTQDLPLATPAITETAPVPAPTKVSTPQPEPTIVPPVPTSVPDLAQEQEVEPESAIDPLFITYVCNDRADPAYPDAVEQWGYLTHGGKVVICTEYLNQNNEFVSQQQELLADEIRSGEFNDYVHIKVQHDNNPDEIYRAAASAAGLHPSRLDSVSYFQADLLLLANTSSDQVPSIRRIYEGLGAWANSDDRAPFGFASAGEVLSLTLTNQSNHLARLLHGVQSITDEFDILYAVLHSLHYSRAVEWDLFELRLERTFETYLTSAPGDLWFHEWLLRNPDTFLAYFWPDVDWIPAPAP